MRILIAEDDFTSRTVLAGVLKKSGHEVVETINGAEAWDALRQPDAPPLVILDWMMPEVDGPEVVRRVRALQTDRPPYVIMLTTKGDKADIIAGLEAGANDYLAKPFDPGELRARVEVGRRMVEMQAALIKSREMLAQEASHDPLTGLLNRRAILDRLREEFARAGRHGDLLALGMCDIDHFKQVNDTYGHQTGDDVLCGLAQILSESIREYDSVGRMGGGGVSGDRADEGRDGLDIRIWPVVCKGRRKQDNDKIGRAVRYGEHRPGLCGWRKHGG